jgi:surface polysaccharide O-acyltransferase-like enzyme
MVKKRIFYYDLLRAFAIVAVIMCHVDPFFGNYDPFFKHLLHSIFHDIGLLGVPIFLMISGALLLNRDYDLAGFIKRRFSRICYPFVFWIIIILSIGILYFNWNAKYAWNVFIGGPASIIWFFWMLVGVYLFLPVVNAFIQKYGLRGAEYFLAIYMFTALLKTFNIYPLFPSFDLNYFASFIGYPVLGYYLTNKDFKVDDKKMLIIGLAIFLVFLAIYVSASMYKLDIGRHYQNIVNVLMAVGFFIFVEYMDKLNLFDAIKERAVGKMIVSISICSYGMYYAHFIIINYLTRFGIKSNKLVLFVLIFIVVSSWLVTYALSKIPYVKKVCGV